MTPWLYKAQAIQAYVQANGLTQDLCLFTYGNKDSPLVYLTTDCVNDSDASFNPTCIDTVRAQNKCASPTGPQDAANEWMDRYAWTVNDFQQQQARIDAAK